MLVTDMNDRERRKFASRADDLEVAAGKLAQALRGGDDTDVLLQLALTGVSGMFITDLGEIFQAALGVEIPDSPKGLVAPTKFAGPGSTGPSHPLMNEGKEKR